MYKKICLLIFTRLNNVSINATSFVFLGGSNTDFISHSLRVKAVNIIHDEDVSLYDVLSYDSKNMIYQCVTGGDIMFYY